MKKKYIEPSIEEGQKIRALWEESTFNQNFGSREVVFYRAVEQNTISECVEALKLTNEEIHKMAGGLSVLEMCAVQMVLSGARRKLKELIGINT